MKDPGKTLHKVRFYVANTLAYVLPDTLYRRRLDSKLNSMPRSDAGEIVRRVSYYNKLTAPFDLGGKGVRVGSLRLGKNSSYFFDLHRVVRHFDPDKPMAYLFGDITHVPEVPTLLKSRPVEGDNRNSVLLKLDSMRHFRFLRDCQPYSQKKDIAVWRGNVHRKEARKRLIEMHSRTARCDIGDSDPKRAGQSGYKGFLSIKDQLACKFIISVEGNDVATNLKWIMASNSLCFMARPRFETWFMEGTLVPEFHYVALKDDYSDLEEKIEHYLSRPEEAEEILRNARAYVRQFQRRGQEELISLLVVKKYLDLAGEGVGKGLFLTSS